MGEQKTRNITAWKQETKWRSASDGLCLDGFSREQLAENNEAEQGSTQKKVIKWTQLAEECIMQKSRPTTRAPLMLVDDYRMTGAQASSSSRTV